MPKNKDKGTDTKKKEISDTIKTEQNILSTFFFHQRKSSYVNIPGNQHKYDFSHDEREREKVPVRVKEQFRQSKAQECDSLQLELKQTTKKKIAFTFQKLPKRRI